VRSTAGAAAAAPVITLGQYLDLASFWGFIYQYRARRTRRLPKLLSKSLLAATCSALLLSFVVTCAALYKPLTVACGALHELFIVTAYLLALDS
jgi:hypothetical protein